jgi:hypothetical protein
MLGFATIDIADIDDVTVWITNRSARTEVSHGNAVVFRQDHNYDADLIEQMVADRLIVLTPRTSPEKLPFNRQGVEPVDLNPLREATLEAQQIVTTAFEERRATKGKEQLIEPTHLPVPTSIPDDWTTAAAPTLVVANHVAALWRAWLHVENERLKRVKWMPAGYRSRDLRIFPGEFALNVEPLPVRLYR